MENTEFWPSIPRDIARLVPEEINQHILLFLGAGTWWQLACKRWHTTFEELKRLGRFEPPGSNLSLQIRNACLAGHLARVRVLEARSPTQPTERSKAERFRSACGGGSTEIVQLYELVLPPGMQTRVGGPDEMAAKVHYARGVRAAVEGGHPSVVVFLHSRVAAGWAGFFRRTAIRAAAQWHREEIVDQVFELAAPAYTQFRGLWVKTSERSGLEREVVAGAVESCRVDWIEQILDRFGLDWFRKIRTLPGGPVATVATHFFREAATKNDVALVRLALDKGADPEISVRLFSRALTREWALGRVSMGCSQAGVVHWASIARSRESQEESVFEFLLPRFRAALVGVPKGDVWGVISKAARGSHAFYRLATAARFFKDKALVSGWAADLLTSAEAQEFWSVAAPDGLAGDWPPDLSKFVGAQYRILARTCREAQD